MSCACLPAFRFHLCVECARDPESPRSVHRDVTPRKNKTKNNNNNSNNNSSNSNNNNSNIIVIRGR